MKALSANTHLVVGVSTDHGQEKIMLPKISIITPSFNQGQFLEETILSVIGQGYPNLEYIIIDGGSTDNSVDIIKKYESRLAYWVSEPDNGMYHALQKGFEKSTGDIMGWINADDMLHARSLFTIAEILSIPGINWVNGASSMFDESGRCIRVHSDVRWSRLSYILNNHAYIQQESKFWSRYLWDKAGGYISVKYRLAGDFELWGRFFEYENLYACNCLVGGYRMLTDGQLTSDYSRYTDEADEISMEKLVKWGGEFEKKISTVQRLQSLKVWLRRSRIMNLFFLTNRIDKKIESLHNYPRRIDFNRATQKMELI